MGSMIREWLRLYIEAQLLNSELSNEDEAIEEMSGGGSGGMTAGALGTGAGYTLPLGMDPDSVNVKTPPRKNRKKKNKK